MEYACKANMCCFPYTGLPGVKLQGSTIVITCTTITMISCASCVHT